ncbi:hypothetical protein CDV31_016797 [Fusarium ambrosium]|uniref:P-loop containing nucleoside triphosphate hydrolase protein n=1 Tax=Fusarium ambrosium TaxID=131363 RepID=A0A428S232_9HYPO|nr:hypothetical protein CDV31_016797 [Fusarium ambrosium]
MTQNTVIFVLGAPGAGKGTLCKRLARDYGFRHLSVGDLLRAVVKAPDANQAVVDCVQKGELLGSDLLMSILKPQVQNANDTRPILLDGFPRQLDQAKLFEDVYGHAHLVLFFDCPRNLAEERVVTRQAGRDGDDMDTFRRRYGEFLQLNPPVLAHYAAGGRLVIVNTSTDTETTYAKLMEILLAEERWTWHRDEGEAMKG